MVEKIKHITIIGEQATTDRQKTYLNKIERVHVVTLDNSDNITSIIKDDIIVIFNLLDNQQELEKLAHINNTKATLIVIGDKSNADFLSVAISAGVSVFLDVNNEEQELVNAINKTLYKLSSTKEKSTFDVLINAKGGAGASFIASNLAYILSQREHKKAALVDMDLQFGSIGLNFNVDVPRYTVADALEDVSKLDSVSLAGYMEVYAESLSLLLPSSQNIIIPGEINPQSLEKLISLLRDNYTHLLIDLPRIIDPLSMMIMEKADNIIIVLQQSLAQFRDGKRLINILNKDLEIPLDRIVIIINRYDKNNSLRKEDMIKLVNHKRVYTVTNDFELVASSSNLGIPLCENSVKSKIAKDLRNIASTIGEDEDAKKEKNKFFGRFFS